MVKVSSLFLNDSSTIPGEVFITLAGIAYLILKSEVYGSIG